VAAVVSVVAAFPVAAAVAVAVAAGNGVSAQAGQAVLNPAKPLQWLGETVKIRRLW